MSLSFPPQQARRGDQDQDPGGRGVPHPADLCSVLAQTPHPTPRSQTGPSGCPRRSLSLPSPPPPFLVRPGGRGLGAGVRGTWGGPHVGQTPAPPPRPQGQPAIYSPLRLGRWAQLLGHWEPSGRGSRRVPGPAWVSQGGRAGQEPGSRPACPPRGRPGPASLWALPGRPQPPARGGVVGGGQSHPLLCPRWVGDGPEEWGLRTLAQAAVGETEGPGGTALPKPASGSPSRIQAA